MQKLLDKTEHVDHARSCDSPLSFRQGNIHQSVSVKICKCEEVMFAIWFQASENKEIQTQWRRDKNSYLHELYLFNLKADLSST